MQTQPKYVIPTAVPMVHVRDRQILQWLCGMNIPMDVPILLQFVDDLSVPTLNPHVVREYVVQGAESGRVQTSEPNFTEQDKEETDRVRCEAGDRLPLDHLPEGSC